MLGWSIVFAVLAVIAGFLGFVSLAGLAASIAKILFVVFLVVSLTLGLIAVFGAWAYYSGGLAGKHGNREAPPQVARSVTTQPATPKQAG